MSVWMDLLGTVGAFFRIGLAGPRLKNNSGVLEVKDAADSAYAAAVASKVSVTGDDIDINSDAAGSANDWLLTLRRNAAQTEALVVTFPPAKGTDGHVLRQKAGTAAGVLELELAAAGSTDALTAADTTSLAFGASSPVTMFQLPSGAVIDKIKVIIDTAFDGTPSASVGIAGTTSKYVAATQIDLTFAAETVFEIHPGKPAPGSAEDLIITYSAGGAAAGAARFLVYYTPTPS